MARVQLSEILGLVAAIDPQLVDDASVTSHWASLGASDRIMFILNVGATDTTVDAKIQQATDSSGTGAADITNLASTQLSGTDDSKKVILEVSGENLTGTNDHVALVVTVGNGTTGAYISAAGIGSVNYPPSNKRDLASVAEIVTL